MYSGSSQVVYYFDDSFTGTRGLYRSPSQLCLVKRIGEIVKGPDSIVQSYTRAHVPAYPHTPTRIHTRTHTGSSSKRTEIILGGVSLQSVSTTWRNVWRCTPFLTTLGTHCRSRSGPRSPTRSAHSPASPLSPWLLAPRHTHTQSRPSDRPLQHQGTTSTPTRTYSSGVCLFSSDGQGVCV